MTKISGYELDVQNVVSLGLCSHEDAMKLSFEELDQLILKADNILKTVEELDICSSGEALNSYTYKELEELIKNHEN